MPTQSSYFDTLEQNQKCGKQSVGKGAKGATYNLPLGWLCHPRRLNRRLLNQPKFGSTWMSSGLPRSFSMTIIKSYGGKHNNYPIWMFLSIPGHGSKHSTLLGLEEDLFHPSSRQVECNFLQLQLVYCRKSNGNRRTIFNAIILLSPFLPLVFCPPLLSCSSTLFSFFFSWLSFVLSKLSLSPSFPCYPFFPHLGLLSPCIHALPLLPLRSPPSSFFLGISPS